MRINIIGAGRVGQTLGYLLHQQGYNIGSICNQGLESGSKAVDFIGAGKAVSCIADMLPAEMTLITTPDAQIETVSKALAQSSHLTLGSIIVHCSGVLTSAVLSETKIKQCFVASIHPMRSFSIPAISIMQYTGTYCAMEGDRDALSVIEPLFQSIGSITYRICKEGKSEYHAAGVFASNYLLTLADQAIDCLERAGVDRQLSTEITIDLMKGTLFNLEQTLSPHQSLTGPIKRGDIETIKQHLACFSDQNQKKLYALLGLQTMDLAVLNDTQQNTLKEALVEALL